MSWSCSPGHTCEHREKEVVTGCCTWAGRVPASPPENCLRVGRWLQNRPTEVVAPGESALGDTGGRGGRGRGEEEWHRRRWSEEWKRRCSLVQETEEKVTKSFQMQKQERNSAPSSNLGTDELWTRRSMGPEKTLSAEDASRCASFPDFRHFRTRWNSGSGWSLM